MAYYPVVIFCVYFIVSFAFNANASRQKYQAVNRQGQKGSENVNNSRANTVVMNVYYESLCPASADFFTEQLEPAVEVLGSRMEVLMTPYGNAETKYFRGFFRFSCQHGLEECYGNKLHACAIDIIRNNTKAVFYNTCLMKYSQKREDFSVDFTTALNWCGYKYNVPIKRVWNCAHSRRGIKLLRHFGQETHKLDIKYVPYVLLDGSSDMQDQATGNLIATICQMLEYPPHVCKHYTERRSHENFVKSGFENSIFNPEIRRFNNKIKNISK